MANPEPAVTDAANQRVARQQHLDGLPLIQPQFAKALGMPVLAADPPDAQILAGGGTGERQVRFTRATPSVGSWTGWLLLGAFRLGRAAFAWPRTGLRAYRHEVYRR